MRRASIFFFVCAFAAPIVNFNPVALPITHRVPVDKFVWPKILAGTEAGVSPEFSDFVEAGKDAAGDALPFRIARPNQ